MSAMRRLLPLFGLVLFSLLLACSSGGAAAPSKEAPKPAAPAANPASPASPAAGPLTPDQWERILTEAKREGTVVVYGHSIPELRRAVTEGFQKAYPIKVDYVTGPSGEMRQRIEQEVATKRVSIDVRVSGVSEADALKYLPEKWFEALDDKLLPEVVDPAAWKHGKIKWVDNDQRYMPQATEWIMTDLFTNASIVPPASITSWRDLLKPEYKSKIAAFDPRIGGPGIATGRYILHFFGDQYARDLYEGQGVTLTRDPRQLAEWVARGVYPIGLGLDTSVEQFRAEGFPVERVFPADGPGSVLGGYSVANVYNGSPHPNAAIVYVNWLLSREGQEIYTAAIKEPSLRVDVPTTGIPEYIIPKPGVDYPDQYAENWLANISPDLLQRWNNILVR